MYYVIEVNLSRRGTGPIWADLRDDDDDPMTWDNEVDARRVLADENRGANARLVCYSAGPEFPPIPVD
jgi:hypothetical protein